MRRMLYLAAGFSLFLAVSAGAQVNTTSSGVYVAHKVGSNCTNADCAVKIPLTVYLPLGAQVKAIRCYSVAGGPAGDFQHGDLHQVACGVDGWWSIFTRPILQSSPQNMIVMTEFQNRSDNRDRDARIEVDWVPYE